MGTVSGNEIKEEEVQSTVSDNTVTISENDMDISVASVPLAAQEYQSYWGKEGNYSNLVVFVDFADTDHDAHEETALGDCLKDAPELTFKYFNGSEALPKGMRQYLYNISYGQLRVENIFPQYDSVRNTFDPYVLKYDASYYVDNREAMMKEVIDAVNSSGQIHPDMKLNLNSGSQNILDNLTIVVACESKNSNKLYSGIATTYFGTEKIAGCKVSKYNLITEAGVYYNMSNSGVIIHEFMHTLGYPDLYHQGNGIPVGTWDIMASESTYVQYPLAYTRSHYSNWFTIPELMESKTNIVLPAASATNNSNKDKQALILKTDYSDTEFFVVEYRKQGNRNTEDYEVKIPGSGLIVYRVDTKQITNFIGPPDMIYIYRPGDNFNSSGQESGSGNIYQAHLSLESGRTSFGSSNFADSLAEGAITYSDGRNSGIVISNVGSAAGNEITFDITFTEPEEGMWATIAREEEGAGSTDGASCMDDQGNFYFILEKNGSDYLYYCSEGKFTQLGKAPEGSYHKLGYYNGSVYVSYLAADYSNSQGQVKKWNGSSWGNVYTTKNIVDGSHMDFYGNENGLYLAYATEAPYSNNFKNSIFGVIIDGSGTREVEVASNLSYGAYPSVYAEEGRIAIAFSEVFQSSGANARIRILEQSSNSWEDIPVNFRVDTLKMKLDGNSIYLLTSEQDGSSNFYSYSLNSPSAVWEKMGGTAFATNVGPEYDFSFVRGNPHIIYMEGVAPNAVYVKYLKDGQWTTLGDSIVQANVAGLGFFEYEDRLYAAYVNKETTSQRAFVRSNRIEAPEIVIPDYDWAYGYHAGTEGGTDLTVIPETSQENIISNLSFLPLEEGEIIEIFYQGKETDKVLSRELLELVAEKGWILRWYPRGVEEELSFGIQGSDLIENQSYEDVSFGVEFLKEEGVLPEEFIETGCFLFQVTENLPEYGIWEVILTGEQVEKTFADSTSLYLWEEKEGKLQQLRELNREQDNTIFVPVVDTDGSYVITSQGSYGWVCVSENGRDVYKYVEHRSGEYVKGWEYINGIKCYFDESGNLLEGISTIAGEVYLFGRMENQKGYGILTGLQSLNGKEYYPDETGKLRTGWQLIKDNWCYFSPEEENFGEKTVVSDNGYWIAKGKNTYHYDFYGNVKKGYAPSGTSYYYFNNQGIPQSGWKKCEDRWRYFSPQAGDNFGKEVVTVSLGGGWYEKDRLGNFFTDKEAEEQTGLLAGETERFYFANDKTLTTGWKTISGKRYYFEKDGSCVVSWNTISGKLYYFLTEGEEKYSLVTGTFQINGKNYHADSNGVLSTGWKEVDGEWKYYDPTTGEEREVSLEGGSWAKAGEDYFYLENGKKPATGWKTFNGMKYYFSKEGILSTGFFMVGKDWYYGRENLMMGSGLGSVASGEVSIELSSGEMEDYLFKSDGKMLTGWQKTGDQWNYYEAKDGEDHGKKRESSLVSREGDYFWYKAGEEYYCFYRNKDLIKKWKNIGNYRYYFDPVTGQSYRDREETIDKKRYRFLEDGKMAADLLYQDKEEKTYGYNAKGEKLIGWNKVQEEWYYFDLMTGVMDITAKVYSDYFAYATVDGIRTAYYLEKNTKVATGWKTIGDYKYYFDSKGVMQKQKVQIGKDIYFFAHNGKMRTGFVTYCDTMYYFLPGGKMAKGWQKVGSEKYYFDANGVMQSGFVTVGKNIYYLEEKEEGKGRMLTGITEIDGEIYYFNASGIMVRGWRKLEGLWMYFDENGARCTVLKDPAGKVEVTTKNDEIRTAFFGKAKKPVVGWNTEESGRVYYDSNGFLLKEGFHTISGKTYYIRENGAAAAGFFLKEEDGINRRYYFNSKGEMTKGWLTLNKKKYYFDISTGEQAIGSQVIDGKNYLFQESEDWSGENTEVGTMVTGYVTVFPASYYFNSSGVMMYGWQQVEGVWKYFDYHTGEEKTVEPMSGQSGLEEKEGIWEVTGLEKKEVWYSYFKKNKLQKGWQQIEGFKYYFDTSSGQMALGHQKIGGKWYYFDKTEENPGRMRSGRISVLEEGEYLHDESGVRLFGWQLLEGEWYYFEDTPSRGSFIPGCKRLSKVIDGETTEKNNYTWLMIEDESSDKNGKIFCMKDEKTVLKGKQKINNKTFYFDSEGSLLRGKVWIENKMYHLDPVTGELIE